LSRSLQECPRSTGDPNLMEFSPNASSRCSRGSNAVSLHHVALAASCAVLNHPAQAKTDLIYDDVVKIINNVGVKGDVAPQVRIAAPLGDGIVAPGRGDRRAGTTKGTGFLINLEIFARDDTPVLFDEATQDPSRPGIRHAERVGEVNEDFPGLFVFIDRDLVKPDGGIIRRNAGLANLFNVAGTDDTPAAARR